jgi:hypothetical protein
MTDQIEQLPEPITFSPISVGTVLVYGFVDPDGKAHAYTTSSIEEAASYARQNHCMIRTLEFDLGWNMIIHTEAHCPVCFTRLNIDQNDQRIYCPINKSHYFARCHTPMYRAADLPAMANSSQDEESNQIEPNEIFIGYCKSCNQQVIISIDDPSDWISKGGSKCTCGEDFMDQDGINIKLERVQTLKAQ